MHTHSFVLASAIMILAALSFTAPDAGARLFIFLPASPEAQVDQPPEPANTMCPVSPDEEIDPSFFTQYKGRRVYLCCKKCRTKFEADPEAYIANLPAIVAVTAESPQHEHDNDHQHEHAEADNNEVQTSDADHDEAGAPDEADGHDEADEHDHATAHGGSNGFELLPYLGRFHVLVTHFPIALLAFGAVFEIIGWLGRKPGTEPIVRAAIGFGALGAVAAMLLGLANAIEADYAGTLASVFWWHRVLGITTAVLALTAMVAVEMRARSDSPRRTVVARVAVLAVAALIPVTAHFGGSLVFGWEYLLP